jgi:hypothetical protein
MWWLAKKVGWKVVTVGVVTVVGIATRRIIEKSAGERMPSKVATDSARPGD